MSHLFQYYFLVLVKIKYVLFIFRGFQVHSFLPYYYAIKGKRKDGYTHVLYLNGGHPTWGLLDYVKLAGITLCSFSPHRYLYIQFRSFLFLILFFKLKYSELNNHFCIAFRNLEVGVKNMLFSF